MPRNTKKKRSGSKKWIIILFFIIVILAVTGAVVFMHNRSLQSRTDTTDAETTEESFHFPYTSEDGNLQFLSLIQFTGPNPDAENADSEDIAGLQIQNISEQYLKEADVKVLMEDGIEYHFLVKDLPAGSETVAFDLSNQSYDGQAVCREIQCTTQTGESSMGEERVEISTDESKLIVTNISDQQIENVAVIYRCSTGDSYIGGISYEITVSELAAGESFEFEDTACIFGTPEAVSVEID